ASVFGQQAMQGALRQPTQALLQRLLDVRPGFPGGVDDGAAPAGGPAARAGVVGVSPAEDLIDGQRRAHASPLGGASMPPARACSPARHHASVWVLPSALIMFSPLLPLTIHRVAVPVSPALQPARRRRSRHSSTVG